MSDIKVYKVTEPFLDLHCDLGESPFWDEKTKTLRWVDIVKKHLHTLDPVKGASSHQQTQLDVPVCTTANIEGNDEEFVFGGKTGVGIMNKKTHEWRYINKFWTDEEVQQGREEKMRANDGAVDAHGRYFVNTMNDPTKTEIGKNGG